MKEALTSLVVPLVDSSLSATPLTTTSIPITQPISSSFAIQQYAATHPPPLPHANDASSSSSSYTTPVFGHASSSPALLSPLSSTSMSFASSLSTSVSYQQWRAPARLTYAEVQPSHWYMEGSEMKLIDLDNVVGLR
jgi:hypothetical protein